MLLAEFRFGQQNRNYERNKYKQQIEELKEKLEDLTKANKLLTSPSSKMTQKNI